MLRSLRVTLLVLVASCLLFAALPVQAKVAAGATPMYTNAIPPAGGSGALQFTPTTAADGTASCVGSCPSLFTYTATSAAIPAMTFSGTTLEGVSWFKSWNNAPAVGMQVSMSVKFNGQEVAKGTKTLDVLNGAFVEFRIAMPYTGPAETPAGTIVSWVVTAKEGHCSCYTGAAYPRGASSAYPWSIGLPGEIVVPPTVLNPIYEDLFDSTVTVVRSFENATTQGYVFNWTAPETPLQISAAINGTGNATISLVDAENMTIFEGNLTDVPIVEALQGAVGNWTLRLDLDDFIGEISIAIEEIPHVEEVELDDHAAVNKLTNSSLASDGTKATPVPLAVALMAVFVALAVTRRWT